MKARNHRKNDDDPVTDMLGNSLRDHQDIHATIILLVAFPKGLHGCTASYLLLGSLSPA